MMGALLIGKLHSSHIACSERTFSSSLRVSTTTAASRPTAALTAAAAATLRVSASCMRHVISTYPLDAWPQAAHAPRARP
jgi:hypothetical protein